MATPAEATPKDTPPLWEVYTTVVLQIRLEEILVLMPTEGEPLGCVQGPSHGTGSDERNDHKLAQTTIRLSDGRQPSQRQLRDQG